MKHVVLGVISAAFLGSVAHAGEWVLDSDASHLAFGSIKQSFVGEVNTFNSLAGKVSPDGDVSVEIDLSSLETNIPIRNERMMEHVFKHVPNAGLTAQVDMDKLEGLGTGEMDLLPVSGKLSFLGRDIPVNTEMMVVRLTDDRVMVSTNDMVFVMVEVLGATAGVDKLMELAALPSITRTVPVTMRLVFNAADPNT